MNKIFEGKRFQAMKTACLLVPEIDGKLRARFPKCARLGKDGMTAVHYLCLVYDPRSPLRDDNYNVQSRKDAAISLLDLRSGSKEDALRTLGSDAVIDALQEILKFIDDFRWRSIIQFEELYDNNERQLFVGIKGDKDTDRMRASESAMKLAKNNLEIENTLRTLWNEYTGGDEDARELIRARRPLSPEDVAAWELPDTKKEWMDDLRGEDVLQKEQT